MLQELIETEAAERIGADRYERTDTRVTDHRNGARPRVVVDPGRGCAAADPEAAEGFVLSGDLGAAAADRPGALCGGGGGLRQRRLDRSVENLVVALGIDSGISKSEVSRICAGLDEIVTAFRSGPLHHTAFPYVFLDATYLHVRRTGAAGQVMSMAVVVATGVTAAGGREVLGVDVGDSEDEVFWRGFLRWLQERGLHGTQLVISDQHAGLVAALRRVLQGVVHQRCRVTSPQPVGAGAQSHKDMVAAVPDDLRPTRRRHRRSDLGHRR